MPLHSIWSNLLTHTISSNPSSPSEISSISSQELDNTLINPITSDTKCPGLSSGSAYWSVNCWELDNFKIEFLLRDCLVKIAGEELVNCTDYKDDWDDDYYWTPNTVQAEEWGEWRACGMSELNLRELLSQGLKVMYFQADVTFKTDLNISPRQEEYFLFLSTWPSPARQIFYLDLKNFWRTE